MTDFFIIINECFLQNILQILLYHVLFIEINIYQLCRQIKIIENMIFYVELTLPPPPLNSKIPNQNSKFKIYDHALTNFEL